MKKLLLLSLALMCLSFVYSQSSAHKDCMHTKIKSLKRAQNFVPHGLSDDYDITYQRTFWNIDPAQLFIEGSVTSYFKTLSDDFNAVHFDLSNSLTVDSVIYHNAQITPTHSNDIVKINLPNTLAENTIDSITVYYHGVPTGGGFGSFATDYHSGTPILWTLSEPYGAKDWWPCKQTLTDKIDSIDIYVQNHKDYKVGSNGVLMSEETMGTTKTTHWKHRHPITTYLVAIAVTNYAEFSDYAMVDETNSVEILNYVYPEHQSYYEPMAEYTVDVMELFSELFIPYPFWNEKYGHAQFGWGGGMEHQTMSFMGGFSQGLIAHELAHQWFGDYITCGSWQDIWVNEGFAVFCENIAVENLHPADWYDWKNDEMQYVLSNGTSGSVYVDDTTSVGRIFSGVLTYAKGGYVLHMLRNQIGDEAFFAGIKNYLVDASFANAYAKGADVQAFLEESADTSLTEFFNDWYYGQGYPEYDIKWWQNESNQLNVIINQSQTHSSVDFFDMHVPLLLQGSFGEKTIQLHNTYNGQAFTVDLNGIVESVEFDPNLNILTPHSNVVVNSVIDNEVSSLLQISPNPVSDILSYSIHSSETISSIDIYSISGKVVKQNMSITNAHSIDVSNLSNGIYFLHVTTENNTYSKKFVKEN